MRRKKIAGRAALALAAAFLLLSAWTVLMWPLYGGADSLSLKQASFSDLHGWQNDDVAKAVAPLEKSCQAIGKKNATADVGAGGFAGKAQAWQDVCRRLAEEKPADAAAARKFFEGNFMPYAVFGKDSAEGLFTGYYEPILHGSFRKHGRYAYPLYARPRDLVSADLGDFRPDLKGITIAGRVKGEQFIPYYDRAEIDRGALKDRREEIVWADNPVDVFFLHIQGSGVIRLDNGHVLRVSYAAENGHPYTAIGRALIAMGALTKDSVSMQSIRAWLEKNPHAARKVMDLDASYVFFRKLKDENGPIGAEGVALTPERSLAVDRRKMPYGAPVWLAADDPDGGQLARLMVAQDTGGAITGAVRGDFFWGAGDKAAHKAGLMKSAGRYWILLPKSVNVPEDRLWSPWRLLF